MEQQLSEKEQELAVLAEDQVQATEDPQERNWRQIREALAEEKAARKRQEIENAELKAMLAQAFQPPQQHVEEDDELDVYAEDFGKKLERKLERVVEKTYEKIEQKKRSDPSYLEEQARKKYSDFDNVMTPDNIDNIIKANPLVHDAVMKSGKPLEAAYEFIKQSAAYAAKQAPPPPQVRRAQEEKAKLADNLGKPLSPNAVPRSQAMSAIHGFGRLTEAQAREIHAETMRITRGR